MIVSNIATVIGMMISWPVSQFLVRKYMILLCVIGLIAFCLKLQKMIMFAKLNANIIKDKTIVKNSIVYGMYHYNYVRNVIILDVKPVGIVKITNAANTK